MGGSLLSEALNPFLFARPRSGNVPPEILVVVTGTKLASVRRRGRNASEANARKALAVMYLLPRTSRGPIIKALGK